MPANDDSGPGQARWRQLVRVRAAAPALAIALVAFLAWYAMLGGPALRWHQRGVEASSYTHFRDLVTILAGAHCSALGYDVLVENPCDPDGTRMNYPRVWTALVHGTGAGRLSASSLGMGLAVAFFLATVSLMRVGSVLTALLWALVLLSPAVTLAVERSNNDLVVFVMIVAGTHLLARARAGQAAAALLMFLASALKLFPALALPVLFFRRERYARRLAAFSIAAFAAIVLLTWRDLVAIGQATPHSVGLAYGGEVMAAQLFRLSGLAKDRPIYLTPGLRIAGYAFSATLPLLGVGLGLLLRRRCVAPEPEQRSLLQFLAGVFIFVGTFALGSNWDYRLTFLLLALPGTMQAAQGSWGRGWIRGLGAATSGLLVVALWAGGAYPRSWPWLVRAVLVRLDVFATPMLLVLLAALAMLVVRQPRPSQP
jgi:hypothetical protein